jgi:crotonobetaine/carnitine-CoA ligase
MEKIQVFVVGAENSEHDFTELLQPGAPLDDEPSVTGADPAVILYTGGTTGLPKGVVLPQTSFVLAGIRYGETFSVRAGERHFTTLPLFHAAAMQFGVMGPLLCDMTTVIDRRFSVSNYWERVSATKANVIDPIGTMVGLLCSRPPSSLDRKHEVRVAVGITGQVPALIPEEFQRRFGIPLVSVYGLTEAGGAMITGNRLGRQREGTNGQTYGWAELRIADENGLELPRGQIGEILLRPTYPNMFMREYLNNPVRTLETFRDLWLHTGDLGRVDEDGYLTFTGRRAHWIRRRGENVSAYEVEGVLSGHPAVAEIVVIGLPSPLGEDDIKAFVIVKPQVEFDPVAFTHWAAERLAPFKVPRFIEVVPDFPRSVTKREVERATLKSLPNDKTWDRETVMGQLSSQAARSARG